MKPLKVAILTTDKRDHERDYENPTPGFGTAPEALLQGFEILPDVEVHVVSCVHRPIASPAKIGKNIFYHSVVVPKLGWMRSLYLGCSRAARNKLREISPDIVHGQGTELDCGLNAVRSGFPNVITIHGNMTAIARIQGARLGSFHWFASKLEKAALKRTGGVFCNSGYTEGLVAPRAHKTWRVANALRKDFFKPLLPPPPSKLPVLLNVGVAEPRKQQLEVLAIARRLHQKGLEFELHFVGHMGVTGYGGELRKELATAERAGYARHLGLLSSGQLIAAMDKAAGLVHFPLEEAFGLVTAEALARNLKFFGSAVGGGVEIASGVDGAELFSPNDLMGLEKALTRWLSVGAPRPQNATVAMRERYHPEVIARRHLEIYREVLGR